MLSRQASMHGHPLVGRETELAILRTAIGAAAVGRGRLVLLSGPAGVGKTRLAAELALEAGRAGARVVWSQCAPEGAPAGGAWHQLLAACADGRTGAPSAPLPGGPPSAVEVLDMLGHSARQAPLVAIVDDLHVADAASLALLAAVAAHLAALPALLVAIARDPHPGGVPGSAALDDLRRQPCTVSVALHGLDAAGVAALLVAYLGTEVAAERIGPLHQVTLGAPNLLHEFIRAALGQRRPSGRTRPDWDAAWPRALRAVVRHRVEGLSKPCQALLAAAAVAGYEFDLAALPAPARRGNGLDAALREAVAAALLARIGAAPAAYAFTDGLVRDTLYDDLPPRRRARMHRQVAAALGRGAEHTDVLTELAHHHFAAALLDGDPADGERAAAYAERAARRAAARGAFADAAHCYRLALNALRGGSEREQARLWVELGDVLHLAGDEAAARAAFAEAVAPARRHGDSESLARAALGASGRYMEVGAADASLVALLAEALVRLPSGDSALRARLMARLGVELAYTHQPERAAELSIEAAAVAERSGDSAALAYAFGAAHLTGRALDDPRRRLAMADELLHACNRADDGTSAAEICGWRVDCLVELGDRVALDAAIDRHAALAAQIQTPVHTWLAALFRTTRTLLDGDLGAAEPRAVDAAALGDQAGDANAAHAFAAQLFYVRAEQGRLDELRDGLAAAIAEYPAMPAWAAGLALVHTRAGRGADARAVLERLAPNRFAALPRDRVWLMSMAFLSETSAALPGTPHAATLYALLEPFADRHVAITGGAASWGAVARYLGRLALALGRREQAQRHLAAAVAMNTRLGAPLLTAHARCDQAELALRRRRGGGRAVAAAIAADLALARSREWPHLATRLAALAARAGAPPPGEA